MSLYRRIGFATGEDDLRALEEEMADRFGKLPEETDYLLICSQIKLYCRECSIIKCDIAPKAAVYTFDATRMKHPERIADFVQSNAVRYKIKPGDKLVSAFPHIEITARARLFDTLGEVKRLTEVLSDGVHPG